ncbi:MAG: pyridoxamine 5'-phosphate oxidase family protein [Myxococcales bacterium]
MSRELGKELPEALLSLLDGRDLTGRMAKAILIATVDSNGWAHPALLSYGEVIALDARRLRVATYRSSRTTANLRRSGRLTLCLIEAGTAYYVKAQAVEQRADAGLPELARFEAAVEQVLADQARDDLEPGARITCGIEFDPGRPPADALAAWAVVLKALRG